MAGYTRTIEIGAPPDVVWSVLQDVEKWPDWTPSILSVARQEQGTLAPGSTAKVKARGFPESLLRVTDVTPGRAFAWEGPGGPGVRIVMGHAVEAAAHGSRVTLSVVPKGPAAVLVGWLVARLAKRNVDTEAESLKRRAEALAASGDQPV